MSRSVSSESRPRAAGGIAFTLTKTAGAAACGPNRCTGDGLASASYPAIHRPAWLPREGSTPIARASSRLSICCQLAGTLR